MHWLWDWVAVSIFGQRAALKLLSSMISARRTQSHQSHGREGELIWQWEQIVVLCRYGIRSSQS